MAQEKPLLSARSMKAWWWQHRAGGGTGGTGRLVTTEGKMNVTKYRAILEKTLSRVLRTSEFQQDDAEHTAEVAQE